MGMSFMQTVAAFLMLGVAVLLFIAIRNYLRAGSEKRMRAMLAAVGVDPALATSGDAQLIMREVRQRCRNCAVEGVCERWLHGEHKGGNSFCPNAQVFEMLAKQGGAAA